MNQWITFENKSDTDVQRPFLSKGAYVYQLLKRKIVNGSLERNKIYTIVEIAEGLGVSRTPVGEAVKILASQDYINLQQGVGFTIKELTIADIRENLIISGALEEAVIRKIIQDGVACTEKLQETVERSQQALKNMDSESYTQASADFHKELFTLSGLHKVAEILREHVFSHEIWYREGARRYPDMTQLLIGDHKNIVDLICNRESSQIAEVINAHVENCAHILTMVIQE